MENGSSHPLAAAISPVREADGIPLRPATQARSIPGRSITAKIAGRVVDGRFAPSLAEAAAPAAFAKTVAILEDAGKTVVLVVSDGISWGPSPLGTSHGPMRWPGWRRCACRSGFGR